MALEILARMKGLEVLQSVYVNPTQKSALCNEYLDLGQSYREEAEKILIKYRAPLKSLDYPRKIRNNP